MHPSARRLRRRRCRRWELTNWSARRWMHWLPTPICFATERARVRLLLVDDAQNLDPQAARLVRVLAAGAELTVLAGDPNQAVFGFRGGDPELLTATDGETIELTRSHRCAPEIARAIAGIAARLPGTGWRTVDGSGEPGRSRVTVAGSVHAEAALVADALRRAHLIDGCPGRSLP